MFPVYVAVAGLVAAVAAAPPVVPSSYSATINATLYTNTGSSWGVYNGYFAPSKVGILSVVATSYGQMLQPNSRCFR